MINVAILGYGTVGSGVAEVIAMNGAPIAKRAGQEIRVKYIVDVRDFADAPPQGVFVKDFGVVERDPEVQVVVETIGGATIAQEFTRRALAAGKHVVTSNKELVAEYGHALLELAQAKGVRYLFEASVGGGIPLLHPLRECLAANEIEEICGILNGTTNYILTRMIRAGLTFQDALREAQENGYAERNPAADIEGKDACRKICILSDLAFGKQVFPQDVPTEGITAVTLEDVRCAAAFGRKIKLLGRVIQLADGKLCAYVAPHLVSLESPLANVEDVFNAVLVTGNAVGDVMFYGRGAGKLPTASAVVGDIVDIASNPAKRETPWTVSREPMLSPVSAMLTGWYVRAERVPETIRPVQESKEDGAAAFLTEPMTAEALGSALSGVRVFGRFRVLD
ncbi:MAG TPA: homoserine dehydrogenase [Oscillospiraceae bacterium]|nr:homoserine dehydrogenase [Oscillospiraceae bacterium]